MVSYHKKFRWKKYKIDEQLGIGQDQKNKTPRSADTNSQRPPRRPIAPAGGAPRGPKSIPDPLTSRSLKFNNQFKKGNKAKNNISH